MWIITNRKIFFIISSIIAVISIASIAVFGFNLGIDFKGGSLLEVQYSQDRPNTAKVKSLTEELGLSGAIVQNLDVDSMVITASELTDEKKIELSNQLSFDNQYPFVEKRYKNLGPTISSELKNKSLFAIMLVVLAIICFIAYTFAGVSRPVSSWRYGLVAIVALVHDILVPTAVFAAVALASAATPPFLL